MLSIQDIVSKTKPQRKQIRETMDSWAEFHPDIPTPEHTRATIYDGLSPAEQLEIRDSMRRIPLGEFLAKSGTTGIAGAAYLVPNKIHDDLMFWSRRTDIVPLIGRVVTGWPGGDLLVDIVNQHTYEAKAFVSGGKLPTETVETVQATITPVSFGIAPRITNDLIEDANFEMVEFHLQNAATSMGRKSTDMAVTDLKTATDGVGTKNSATSATTDTVIWSEVVTAIKANENDLFPSNTLLLTQESWLHNIMGTLGGETAGGAAGDYWQIESTPIATKPPAEGFDLHIHTLDVLFSDTPALHDSTDAVGAAFTTCVILVFDRFNSLLTGRKRWMQLNNYADPTRDLAGCTITARQDSVTLWDDSIYILTEKT